MILKITGGAMILISSYIAGFQAVKAIKDREYAVEEIKKLFEKMKLCALNSRYDISDCITESIKDMDEKLKQRFKEAADNLKNNQYVNCYDAWEATECDMEPLKKEDIEIIDDFFRVTGSAGVGTFISELEETVRKLDEKLHEIKEASGKNKKIYFNICICTGLFTVILLI